MAIRGLHTLLALAVATAAAQQTLVSPCPGCGYPPEPRDDADRTGWTQIFDGRTLANWDGNPDVWKIEDGAIVAESTASRRVGTTYVIWRGGEPGDFELKLEIKADADIHSGLVYRGKVGPNPPRTPPPARGSTAPANRPAPPPLAVPADPKWNVTGYGLDFDYATDNDGNVQDTTRSETQIGWRGHIIRMEPGKRPRSLGSLGDREVMAVLIDDDPAARKSAGVIALQIEQYGTGKIWFRNIWLKQ